MSKKKDKRSDVCVIDDGEFSENPIYIPVSPPSPLPFRGQTINLLLIDDAGYFDNTNKKEITPKKPSPERKRRLRLLK